MATRIFYGESSRADAIAQFQAAYPGLESISYDLNTLDLDRTLNCRGDSRIAPTEIEV